MEEKELPPGVVKPEEEGPDDPHKEEQTCSTP